MAGKPVFPLSYKQVVAAINDYKHKVETGEYPKADWWHFCGTIGMDAESVSKAIKSPPANKMDVARELKKVCHLDSRTVQHSARLVRSELV